MLSEACLNGLPLQGLIFVVVLGQQIWILGKLFKALEVIQVRIELLSVTVSLAAPSKSNSHDLPPAPPSMPVHPTPGALYGKGGKFSITMFQLNPAAIWTCTIVAQMQ